MVLETLGDLHEMSHGHLDLGLTIPTGFGTELYRAGAPVDVENTLNTKLSDLYALVWSAHSTPPVTKDLSFLDPKLQSFLATPAGQALLKFGHIRGDIGADEVARGVMYSLRQQGLNPLFLAPRMGGRTLMDHNRPLAGASLFPVPSDVQEKLNEAYSLSMDTLFAYFTQYRDRIRVVYQPHTMGSGEFDEARVNAVTKKQNQLGLLADSDFEAYQRGVLELIDEWDGIYTDGCNHGPARADCDLVTGISQGKSPQGDNLPYQPIADQGLAAAVRARLLDLNINGKFNDPFPHMTGYPGTRLAVSAAEAAIPQVTFDLAKRHLLQDGKVFHASTFMPDTEKAMEIGVAIGSAARDVIENRT